MDETREKKETEKVIQEPEALNEIHLELVVDKSRTPYRFELVQKPRSYEDMLVCMAILEKARDINTQAMVKPVAQDRPQIIAPNGVLRKN